MTRIPDVGPESFRAALRGGLRRHLEHRDLNRAAAALGRAA